jgi:hypothetical protein
MVKIEIAFATDERWTLDEFGRPCEFMGLAGIKFAHESLPYFLSGMLAKFPFALKRKLEPFLDAA